MSAMTEHRFYMLAGALHQEGRRVRWGRSVGASGRYTWQPEGATWARPLAMSVADALMLASAAHTLIEAPLFKLGRVQFERIDGLIATGGQQGDEKAVGIDVGLVQLAEQRTFDHRELLAAARGQDLADFWRRHPISPEVEVWIFARLETDAAGVAAMLRSREEATA